MATADLLTSTHVKFTDDNGVEWTANPLDCGKCGGQLVHPATLSECHHVFCRECIACDAATVACPLCATVNKCQSATNEDACDDVLVNFLIDTTQAPTEQCANCEQSASPMYYCSQCDTVLCTACRASTHGARMFAHHRLVPNGERVRNVRALPPSTRTCPEHDQPYILYATDAKRLLCIACFRDQPADRRQHVVDVLVGQQLGVDKVGRVAGRLRRQQHDLCDKVMLTRQLLGELNANADAQRTAITTTFQSMVDALSVCRDGLLTELEDQVEQQRQHFEV